MGLLPDLEIYHGTSRVVYRQFLFQAEKKEQFRVLLMRMFGQVHTGAFATLYRWFNKRHGMRGILWEDHFHSANLQGGLTARTMAACIDLNCPRSTHAMSLPICSSANVGDWAFGSVFSADRDL
jgi:hypothetical protein